MTESMFWNLVIAGLVLSLVFILWPTQAHTAPARPDRTAPTAEAWARTDWPVQATAVQIAWRGTCMTRFMLTKKEYNKLAEYSETDVHYLMHITIFCLLMQQAADLFRYLSRNQAFYTSILCQRFVKAEQDMVAAHTAIGLVYSCLRPDMQHESKRALIMMLGDLYNRFDDEGMQFVCSIMDEYWPKMQQRDKLNTQLRALAYSLAADSAETDNSTLRAMIASKEDTAVNELKAVLSRHDCVYVARSSSQPPQPASSGNKSLAGSDTARNDQQTARQAGSSAAASSYMQGGNTAAYSKGACSYSSNNLLDDWVPQPKQFAACKQDSAVWPDADLPEDLSVLLKHSRSVVRASMLCQLDLALLNVSQAAASRIRQTHCQPLPEFVTALTDFRSCHASLKKLSTKGSVETADNHLQVTQQLERYNSAKQQLQRMLCCVVPDKKLSKAVQQAYDAQVPLLNLPRFNPTWRPDATHL